MEVLQQYNINSIMEQYVSYDPAKCIIYNGKMYCPVPDAVNNNVMTTCVPQMSNELSNETLNRQNYYNPVRSPPVNSQGSRGIMSSLRDMITRTQDPPGEDQMVLDVTYITERIISMCFVSDGNDMTYRYNLKDVTKMLKTKHQDNYYIINVSDKRPDLTKLNPHVKEYGWPEHLAPPLERLCSICKSMDSWLSSDPQHVVIIHCKGGKGRIANVIAAYMHYSSICASADGALDRFAMKRFYDDKLGGLPQPSQRRYVNYFAGLLSGAIKINSNPLFMHHIVIHGVPNFDTRGGCRPFIKVYQGMQPIFTSGIYNVSDNMQKVCISISPGIPLRGDILIKCYHKKMRTGQREVMWGCQFHTCAISDYNLVFSKQELDDAFNDPRFPEVGKVEFVFGPRSDAFVSVTGFKSDVTVPVDEGDDQLIRSDSFENFNKLTADGHLDTDINENGILPSGKLRVSHQPVDHSQGPVDGSLYATVNKQKETSRIVQNGPSHVANGSINSSMDSGFITSSHQSSQQSYHQTSKQYNSLNTNGLVSSNYNSNVQSSYGTNSLPRDTVKPLDETTQLDNLLQDLLNQQNYISGPSSPSSKGQDAKTITTTTRTFTTYSPTDSQKSPDRVAIQRAEVSYKLPGTKEENRQLLISSSLDEVDRKPSGIPRNAFTYTPTSPRDQSKSYQSLEREMRTESNVKTHTLPYRTDYENKQNDSYYHTLDGSHFSSNKSDNESSNVWLQQQQHKLQSKKDHGDFRSLQEKQLVSELKNAQNKYYTRRAQSESDEQDFMDTSYRSFNGPISPTTAPATYGPPRRAYSTDGFFPDAPENRQHYTTQSVTTETRSFGSKSTSNKPPPSPTQQRFQPVAPPVRTSSRDYMRSRSNSSSSWHPQAQSEPDPQIIPRSYSSSHSTPPRSPRALSPTGPHSTTTYTTYRTLTGPEKPKPAPPPPEKHYVTEVFVHRAGGEKSPTQHNESYDSNRLDELERTLQKASESIMASKTQQTISESHRFENRYQVSNTKSDGMTMRSMSPVWDNPFPVKEQPAPKKISVIEEDRISLQPIGPGVQVLEPETGSTNTLNRPLTPGFPTSPGSGGGHIISPTGTLQHGQGGQHGQTVQYQTSNVQQYQTQQNFSNHDGLSIDTNHHGTLPRGPGSAGSPPSPSSGLNTLRSQLTTSHSMSGGALSPGPHSMTGQSSPSVYFGLSRRGSLSSLGDIDMVHTTPKFVKDTSKFWYKPNITREEAIVLLKDKSPGTFVIRDSNSFPGAFGLALKVATLPPNVQIKPSGDPQADLVRHFLIEPTPKGVRLRGCSNEPVFGSLAALVYQHSMTPLALPCKLALPDPGQVYSNSMHQNYSGGELFTSESTRTTEMPSSASALLQQGAACNVIFINTVDTESLTGPQAVSKAIKMTMDNPPNHKTTMVHFKVSNQGITLTDNQRKLFFRRHYPVTAVTYCGMDPEDRKWKKDIDVLGAVPDARIFGFVARKQGGISDNSCHLFAELDPEQPASAIVNFVTKVMIGQSKPKS
ncbi:hypothetical protein SNE40_023079 [Patella caerulea]|uniref:Phosphatidylinositol-3,4,5-trisphosphate 3-phosphatase n=1 Tax=Patella caerulea TaxID=87958 RepID=A0AAN8GHD4_PATCE